MTLGTLSAVRGLVFVISETPVVYVRSQLPRHRLGDASGPCRPITVFMRVAYLAVSFFLNRTTPGRAIIGHRRQ